MTDTLQEAQYRGRIDFIRGSAITDNPYDHWKEMAQRTLWQDGWEAQQEQGLN